LLVGISEFTLRLLPTLFSLIGIPIIYALGYRLGGRKLGLLAALLWAVNPYQIWHAQDARNYAIWSGLSLGTIWLGLRVVDKSRRADWILYFLVAIITVFVFYMELFTLVVLTLYILSVRWRDWKFIRQWFAIHIVIGGSILLTFVLLQAHLFTSSTYGGTMFAFDPTQWATWFLPTLTFGETLSPAFISVLWPLLLLLLVGSLLIQWWENRQQALFLGMVGIVPLVFLGIVSLKVQVFHPRYVMLSAPIYILLFAKLVFWAASKSEKLMIRRLVPVGLVGGWLIVSGVSLYNHYWVNDYRKAQDWPALADYLNENVAPNDLVIQTSVDAAFGYYYQAPAIDIGLPATPQQSQAELASILTESRTKFASIWAAGRTFRTWPNADMVEQWLQDEMQQTRVTLINGLPVRQFMNWEVVAQEIEKTPLASFENVAELVGVRIFTPPEPTGELTLWLYWRPLQVTENPLKIFIHMTGSVNPATGTPLWTQDDQFPQDGRTDTTSWSTDTVYRDIYTLPVADIPSGDYDLVVGFYNPIDNQRVITDERDSYPIGSVSLGNVSFP
jgi:hypothetical protein